MNISKEFENIKTKYRFKEPRNKTKAIENLVNIELNNQLEGKDMHTHEDMELNDYNVELFGMGNFLYRIRLNKVWSMTHKIEDGKDIAIAGNILYNHILVSHMTFETGLYYITKPIRRWLNGTI
tara:strand:- start:9937 stop:10308 length:372 start_codon:yes stop_codon:yes gene_type:complete